MSSDDGILVRRRPDGKWIGQHYFISADQFPDINEVGIPLFLTMEDACSYHSDMANMTEYGFNIIFDTPDASRVTNVRVMDLDDAAIDFIKNEQTKLEFEKELTELINRYSMENGSNTPDYILAAYLCRELESFNIAVSLRAFHKGEPK